MQHIFKIVTYLRKTKYLEISLNNFNKYEPELNFENTSVMILKYKTRILRVSKTPVFWGQVCILIFFSTIQ